MRLVSCLAWVPKGRAVEFPAKVDAIHPRDLVADGDNIGFLNPLEMIVDDPLLAENGCEFDSDDEDLIIQPTDNVLLAGSIDDDFSQIHAYVYNEMDMYIHHDISLDCISSALEYLPSSNGLNYIVVGNMEGRIDLWNLDIVDVFEPICSLKRENETMDAHSKSVVHLANSPLLENIMASCGADKSIVIWDIDKLTDVDVAVVHREKVNMAKFNKFEKSILLSCSSDSRAILHDLRCVGMSYKEFTFPAGIESIDWLLSKNGSTSYSFMGCCEDGKVYEFDCRGDKCIPMRSQLVSDSNCGPEMCISSRIPGLMVTVGGSSDGSLSKNTVEQLKIWDYSKHEIELRKTKDLKVGTAICIAENPDHGGIFAIGSCRIRPRIINTSIFLS